MATVADRTERRTAKVRRNVRRAAGNRLRLSVFRSSKHIYAQVIDDGKGETVAFASSL
jgi:large subunit ribosomal protein L18